MVGTKNHSLGATVLSDSCVNCFRRLSRENTLGPQNPVAANQHLEAVMGMINHKHNHLRLESQALLRVVLSEGGARLGEKAVAALRQLVRTHHLHAVA